MIWNLFRTNMGLSISGTLTSNIMAARKKAMRTIRLPYLISVPDFEYANLRAVRHRAQRKARRIGLLEDRLTYTRILASFSSHINRLQLGQRRCFCTSSKAFTPTRKIWCMMWAFLKLPEPRNQLANVAIIAWCSLKHIAEMFASDIFPPYPTSDWHWRTPLTTGQSLSLL